MSVNEGASQDKEVQFKGAFGQQLISTMSMVYGPYIKPLSRLLFFGFFGRLLLLGSANLIGYWVDSFCEVQTQQCRSAPLWFPKLSPYEFLMAISGVCLVGLLFTLIFRIGFSKISAQAISQLYDEVTLRTSRFPMAFFDRNPAGRIITRFSTDYGNVFRMFGGPFAEFVGLIFDVFAMLVLTFLAGPIFLVFVAWIGFSNFVMYRMSQSGLRQVRRDLSQSRSPSIAHFAETAQGASVIRIFSKETSFLRRFSKLNVYFLEKKRKAYFAMTSFSMKMNLLTAANFLIVGFVSLFFIREKWVSVGSVGVALTFVVLAGYSLQMFFDWLTQFEEALIGVERLDHYLRSPIELGAKLPRRARFTTGHRIRNESEEVELVPKLIGRSLSTPTILALDIEIKNLNFRYPSQTRRALENLNLKIHAGERIGVVGRTGSGKSTLVQALFYLYPLESGEISLGGLVPQLNFEIPAKANEIQLDSFRRKIAMINQEPQLFRASLRLNLDLMALHADDEILSALESVGLKEWASTLPGQLEWEVEERGRNLSIGERQLLCMARCLLQEAQIVVMDEATSGVDPLTESLMVRASDQYFKGKTQIIIAHRLSTIEKCDRILWMENGRVKAFDRPEIILPEFSQF